MASIPPFFADAVVAIGYEQQNGQILWGASGFFYFHTLKDDQGRVYLVTNKHVLEGKDKVLLRINPKALGKPKGYVLNLINQSPGQVLWRGHRIKKVDVAVIPVNFNLFKAEDLSVSYFHDSKHTLNTKEMEKDGQSDGDSIYALGFPVTLVGDKSNSVIVRSGTIARIRDTLKLPTEPFLVDTTVFPGNSGGPVINKPELIAIKGTKTIDKASLIGIVASYVPYRDVAVSRQTQNVRVVFEENSGLSNVFSVDCIQTIIRSFERSLKKKIQLAEPKQSKKATEAPKDQEIQTSF